MSALHSAFSVDLYRSSASSIDWNFRYVSVNANPTVKDAISAIIQLGTDCHVFLGPGSSIMSTTVSRVIDTAWVDYASTSTELSDKTEHPFFSRVVPTDEVGGRAMADVALYHGWTTVNVLCSDESYGRSITSAFTAALSQRNGHVGVSRCVSAGTTAESMEEVLTESFQNAESRVIAVGMSSSTDSYENFVAAAVRLGMHNTHVFVLAEAACSGNVAYLDLPGSLCVTFVVNATRQTEFINKYVHKPSLYKDALLAQSVPLGSISENRTGVYGSFAHDAVKHVMLAFESEERRRGLDTRNTTRLVEVVRGFTSEGLTGEVTLDSFGDRPFSIMNIINAQPQGGEVVVGTWDRTGAKLNDKVFWLNTGFIETPSAIVEKSTESNENVVTVVAPVVVCVVVLMAIALAGIYVRKLRKKDARNAPKDSSQPFSIVFTDIESSSMLWGRIPQQMPTAIDTHHRLIRKLISKHQGFEVKTIGDSFMIAFTDPEHAVSMALDLQKEFYRHPWSDSIEEAYAQLTLERKSSSMRIERRGGAPAQAFTDVGPLGESRSPRSPKSLWNGLRVRVGAHYGKGDIKFDEVAQSYDYYGNIVNCAARVESVGHGGQVLITEALLEAVDPISLKRCSVVPLGTHPLRGIDEPVNMFQVSLDKFAERQFPRLRLEIDDQRLDDGFGSMDSSMNGSTASMSTASHGSASPNSHNHILDIARRMPMVKRGDWTLDQAVAHVEGTYDTITTLLSTLPSSTESSTIKKLCEYWRVSYGKSFAKKKKSMYQLSGRITETVHMSKAFLRKRRITTVEDPLLEDLVE